MFQATCALQDLMDRRNEFANYEMINIIQIQISLGENLKLSQHIQKHAVNTPQKMLPNRSI